MISADHHRALIRDLDVILDPLEPLPPEPPPPPPDPETPPVTPWQPGDPLPWEQPIPGSTLFVEGAAGEDDAGIPIALQRHQAGSGRRLLLHGHRGGHRPAQPRRDPDMIRENRDASGKVVSYTVRLFQKESTWLGLSHKAVPRDITIDANFHKWHRAKVGDMDGGRTEVWPLVLEEAYSQLNNRFGDGGWPQDAYFALTGRDASVRLPQDVPQAFPRGGGFVTRAPSFEELARHVDQGKAVMLCTIGNEKKAMANGLVAKHCYMMAGYHTDPAGRKVVELYNPWGDKVNVLYDDLKTHFRSIAIGG